MDSIDAYKHRGVLTLLLKISGHRHVHSGIYRSAYIKVLRTRHVPQESTHLAELADFRPLPLGIPAKGSPNRCLLSFDVLVV